MAHNLPRLRCKLDHAHQGRFIYDRGAPPSGTAAMQPVDGR